MKLDKRIASFVKLGRFLQQFVNGEKDSKLNDLNKNHYLKIEELINTEHVHNAWFTPQNVLDSLKGICLFLKEVVLNKWIDKYEIKNEFEIRKVGLVMAGNIPLVGFHDLLCVVLSGHIARCKLSGKDSRLFKAIIEVLNDIDKAFGNIIEITDGNLKGIDAVIATGSNNTSRYFEYYFGKYPHIIRKNRNSVAILSGSEDEAALKLLAGDIFSYFGLGCRNVSKLLVPKDYNFNYFFGCMEHYNHLLTHNKYMNNHDYNRSIYLVNREAHFDNGFLIVKNDIRISSPISVLYFQEYSGKNDIEDYIFQNSEYIQCIVSQNDAYGFKTIEFGQSQLPGLNDYADNIDTLKFLTGL